MTIQTPRARAALFTCLIALGYPVAAAADLYKYETPDGQILISSQPKRGYKLIERIELDHSAPAQESAKSAKRASSRRRAAEAKRAHLAARRHTGLDPSVRPMDRYDDIIAEAAAAYDVPFAFIKAVIRIESNFDPLAVSHAGAQGLMQLMPSVGKALGVRDPFDPRQNVFGGAKLLRQLTDAYDGDINLILAAYNAGGVAVRRYGGIPYAQTRDYVARAYRWYKRFSAPTPRDP